MQYLGYLDVSCRVLLYGKNSLLQLLDLVHRVSLEAHWTRAQSRSYCNNCITQGRRFYISISGECKVFYVEPCNFIRRFHSISNIVTIEKVTTAMSSLEFNYITVIFQMYSNEMGVFIYQQYNIHDVNF